MIKYVVQNKLTKAFRITYFSYLSEEKKYLKEKYNFCASAYKVGTFVIIDEETGHYFVASEQGFNRCYSVITSIPMHPGIPSMKSSDDFKSEIDKRREIFSENVYDWPRNEMAKPVYVNTDIPSLYPHIDVYNMDKTSMHPNLFREFSLWQTKDAPWSPFTHLDIREMKKEKDTMTTKSKTINFCVKKVIFNGPATIVIWDDGTKTVVKCADSDSYSEWAGFAMRIAKRLYGEDFHHQFRHFCGVENDIPKKNTTGDGASIFEAFENLGKSACGCAESLSKALEGYSKVSDYRDVVFKDTFETGLVLKNMRNIVDALGFVSVADCCHMVGAMIHVGDHDIGWTDISKAMIIPVSNGYLIKYPEPASRDQSDRVEKEPNEAKGLD